MCEAHADGDMIDQILTIFSDSQDAALEPERMVGPTSRPTSGSVRLGGSH